MFASVWPGAALIHAPGGEYSLIEESFSLQQWLSIHGTMPSLQFIGPRSTAALSQLASWYIQDLLYPAGLQQATHHRVLIPLFDATETHRSPSDCLSSRPRHTSCTLAMQHNFGRLAPCRCHEDECRAVGARLGARLADQVPFASEFVTVRHERAAKS